MQRRWVATTVAVVLSLPLIPALRSATHHLHVWAEGDPIVVASPGWMVLADHSGSADQGVVDFAVRASGLRAALNGFAEEAATRQAQEQQQAELRQLQFAVRGHKGLANDANDRLSSAPTVTGLVIDSAGDLPLAGVSISSDYYSADFYSTLSLDIPAPSAPSWRVPDDTAQTGLGWLWTDTSLKMSYPSGQRWGFMSILASDFTESERIHTGWHALDIATGGATYNDRIDLEFESDAGEHKRFSLIKSDAGASGSVSTIYFNQPGSLKILPASAGSRPTLRAIGGAELFSRVRDIASAKTVLTVSLITEVVPVTVWILAICWLQALTSWAIRKLPRDMRQSAKGEVMLVLWIAKWGGVGCYTVFTVKDLLGELGVVFGL